MITVPVTPSETPWPTVKPTNSPFWLRVNGEWCHLDGVERGARLDVDRPASDLTTLGGIRYVQVAPRGARTWDLDLEDATPVAIALLTHACTYPREVLFLDRSQTTANLLPAQGGQGPGTAGVLLAGGMPLRRHVAPTTVVGLARRGVFTHVAVWTDAAEGAVVGTVTYPGGEADLVAPGGTTAQRAAALIVADADGPLTLTAAAGTTGLQAVEDWLPAEYLPGTNGACYARVEDPARTLEYLGRLRHSRASYRVRVDEVGDLAADLANAAGEAP